MIENHVVNLELRDVKGFEGLYKVNKIGDIYSSRRSGATGGKLVNYLLPTGYEMVVLSKNNKRKNMRIHRIVADAFLDNPSGFPMINHKNGVKNDNRVENLEWCDSEWNMKHSRTVLGKDGKGENNSRHKLTVREVKLIRFLKAKYPSIKAIDIANFYGMSDVSICSVINFKNWKDA